MSDDFNRELENLLDKYNLLGTHSRDQEIRARYDMLLKEGNSVKECHRILAEEFFTSVKNIEKIVYEKRDIVINVLGTSINQGIAIIVKKDKVSGNA